MATDNDEVLDSLFERIAKDHLSIGTLDVRNRDCLDFHEVHVHSLKNALKSAYYAGKLEALNDTVAKLQAVAARVGGSF